MNLSAAALRRIGVAGQLTTAVGTASLLATNGLSWWLALPAGVMAVLALFVASIALAFAMSVGLPSAGMGLDAVPALPPELARARRQARLRAGAALRCWARECVAVFRMFNWLQPFCSHRRFSPPAARAVPALGAPLPPGPDASLPPVLLVHGYGCNQAVWLDLQPVLAGDGYHCEGIDLEPVLGDIDDYARALHARLRRMTAAHGQPPLLLCHSMGGLAARAALALGRRHGDANLARGLVTLGTPHHGCLLAWLGSGINARQMRCGNAWLSTLAASEGAADRARIVSIFSWHDSIVGPAGASWLDGARNVALAGVGHVSLLRDPAAIAAVRQALRDLCAHAAGAPAAAPAP